MAASWYLVLVVSLAGVMLANSQSTGTEKCTYGGREYVQGEQWVADGCGLTCYCSSAALNASFCFDKCQKFTHLPEGCKMEVTAGECCPRPKCDWMGKCTYKNKAYDQDEEWDDGCDYRCKCVDSTNSFVQCRSKCPTYTSIPSHCQLVSVPNKCCKELSCTGASGTGVQVTPATAITAATGKPLRTHGSNQLTKH
ncbi:uncharacterized protein LOC106178518 [Lingula anatina]|uniref:Uncharacterized protein LOC106178518 n=1 Tax=Lingula anatina TaxID=7574 RepID=A0A2R2MLM5_LINAN|nr:uncharacterized protein LOC106178518 [Lingula anatina]|eukprot:XP_023931104.1 uncharacterized protein LOC106178518 [Lingula anatina]